MADSKDLRRIRTIGGRNLIGVRPQWNSLGLDDQDQFPYESIGALFTTGGDLAGTAWLIGERVALTAAHAAIDDLVLRLPGQTVAIDRVVRHDDYRNPDANELDRRDIAALRLSARAAGTPLELAALQQVQQIELAGFPLDLRGEVMVRQEAVGRLPGDGLLLHRADAMVGHSGAPVMIRGADGTMRAAAIHVGGFNLNPHHDTIRRHNTALLMDGALADFADHHLQSWS